MSVRALRAANTNDAPTPCPSAARPSPAQLEALVVSHAHIVRQIAGGFQKKLPRSVLRDDLVAAGMAGLWDAVRRHGHDVGEGFEWYVRVRVRGAILDELRAQDWLPRRVRAAVTGNASPPAVLRFDDVSEAELARCLSTGDFGGAEAATLACSERDELERAVRHLPEREREIVSQHYFHGVRFKDLAARLGVSEPRISQLHSRAMGRLREILAAA